MTLREALVALLRDEIRPQAFIGRVKSVSQDKQTCDVAVPESYDRLGVRLQAIEDSNVVGQLVVPKVGSWVIVATVNNDPAQSYVAMFSEVDEVWLHGNQHGGLPIVQKVQDNLDALKNFVEAMNAAIGPAFSAVGAGTAANGASGQSSYQGAMGTQSISFQSMENEAVKHG